MTAEILDTPIGRFYATPTKPGHAELRPISDAPITIYGIPYIVRGVFRVDDEWWEHKMPGWQRIEHRTPYAVHVNGYAICRHRPDRDYPDCYSGALTDKGRHAIGRAIGPALKAFLTRPEVRDDARLAERTAAAKRWSDPARSAREDAARLLEKSAKLDAGAAAILAGGPMDEPAHWLRTRTY